MISILIADDHVMFREGLVSLLENEIDFKIVGQASNGEEVIELLQQKAVDVLILDIEMPKMDGFDTMRQIKKLNINTKILVLTMHKTSEFIKNIVRSGAAGYLQKDADKALLIKAIRTIYRQGSYYSNETSKLVLESFQEQNINSKISPREKEIIQLIADGNTTKAIANQLNISKHTVETHRQNILLKLGLNNTAALVKYAIQNGLI